MKCFLSSKTLAVLSLGLVLNIAASTQSKALSWRFDVKTAGNGGTTAWTSGAGIFTNGFGFSSILNQATGGNPFTYSTPSNVTYGEAFTNNFGGTGLEQFPAGVAADFAFTLINTGNLSSQDFFVHGVLESASGGPGQVGIVAGIPQSQTRWRAISLVSTSGPAYAASPSNDPVTGSPSLLISPVIGGSLVNVWIERVRQIPAPGTSNQITGFIADVPEPGTVALLVGCGISGGLFMRRKRRA